MFETKLLRYLDYDKLRSRAAELGKDGWRVMAGWYGQNAHFMALQRSIPKYTGIIRPMIPAPKPIKETTGEPKKPPTKRTGSKRTNGSDKK
jgi:hypothetical protein